MVCIHIHTHTHTHTHIHTHTHTHTHTHIHNLLFSLSYPHMLGNNYAINEQANEHGKCVNHSASLTVSRAVLQRLDGSRLRISII